MFPNFCGAMGFAGWLFMLLFWTTFVALVVWAISRLLPDRPAPPPPVPPQRRQSDAEPPPVESARR
jgi:hypothetical protein